MASRASWKGHLKLSLVTCSIALYPVASHDRIMFHRINKGTGKRLRQQMVEAIEPADTGATVVRAEQLFDAKAVKDRNVLPSSSPRAAPVAERGSDDQWAPELISRAQKQSPPGPVPEPESTRARVPVPKSKIGRGYDVGGGQYVEVTSEELRTLRIEDSHTVEIDSFVSAGAVDKRYLNTPYYVVPTDQISQEPFAVIRDAIRTTNMAALARVVLGGRERPIMLEPLDNGLLGVTLRFPYEIRDPAPVFTKISDIDVSDEMLGLAEHIVRSKTAQFDPAKFHDHYEAALQALLREKQAGRLIAPEPTPQVATVSDLMQALRRSVEAEGKTPEPHSKVGTPKSKARARRHSPSHRARHS
jgi:Ku protein